MSELREVILASLAGLLTLILAASAYLVFGESLTDSEIRQSLVDTWQVNAVLTFGALCIVVPAGLVAALLSWRGTRLAKRLSMTSVGISILTVGLLIGSHALLTERTTRLTGQHFGGLLGLGLGPF